MTSTPCRSIRSSPCSWKLVDSSTMTFVIPNCTMAPEYMWQGMSVEYMVIPRKLPPVLPALSRQSISACMTTARSR